MKALGGHAGHELHRDHGEQHGDLVQDLDSEDLEGPEGHENLVLEQDGGDLEEDDDQVGQKDPANKKRTKQIKVVHSPLMSMTTW